MSARLRKAKLSLVNACRVMVDDWSRKAIEYGSSRDVARCTGMRDRDLAFLNQLADELESAEAEARAAEAKA